MNFTACFRLLLALLLYSVMLPAQQSATEIHDWQQLDDVPLPVSVLPDQDLLVTQKGTLNFSAGSQIGFMGRSGNYTYTWFAPVWTYKLNARLQFNTGIVAGFTTLNGKNNFLLPTSEQGQAHRAMPGLIFFGQATWFASPRLAITGSTFTQSGAQPSLYPFHSYWQRNIQGASLELDYKLFDKVHIGARLRYINVQSPAFYHPSDTRGFTDPF